MPFSNLPLRARLPLRGRPIAVETLALLVSLFLSLASNTPVWQRVLVERSWSEPATWWFVACLFVALTALQFSFIAAVLTRRTARWTLALLLIVAALASHFVAAWGVHIDAAMLRNALHSHPSEAGELLSWDLLWRFAWQAVLPIALLWRWPLVEIPWRHAVARRVGAVASGLVVCVAAIFFGFQDFAAIARNHREWRFLVTPANVVYAFGKLGASGTRTAAQPLQPIGTDARLGAAWARRTKPVLFVIVVGETARAANWGLSGYDRQTTPQLARLEVVNVRDVSSCGTDTATSLPCMFSPWGRRGYDAERIATHQSLLHVLDRATFRVLWRDNQSGCKKVCAGLETEQLESLQTPGLCEDGRCFDMILLDGLQPWVDDAKVNRVLVLHPLGSHGPAYHRRYPPAFARFRPACETAELQRCRVTEIVNAYDNSLLYTDHLLAQTIRFLQEQQSTYDTAMLYVSDHGESLGEHNLFLHGLPRAIAPAEQTRVPMLLWLSDGFEASFGIDMSCLRMRAEQPASHDHLFHTVLGLLDVETGVHEASLDLSARCRSATSAAATPRTSG